MTILAPCHTLKIILIDNFFTSINQIMINSRFSLLLLALSTGFTVIGMTTKGIYYRVPSLRELSLEKLVAIHGPSILESINASNLDEKYNDLIANGSLIQDLFRSKLSLFFINRGLPITSDKINSIDPAVIRKACAHPKEKNLYAFIEVLSAGTALFFIKHDKMSHKSGLTKITEISSNYHETPLLDFMPDGTLIWTSHKGLHIQRQNSQQVIPFNRFVLEPWRSQGEEKSVICSKDTIAIGTDRGILLTAKNTDSEWITNAYKLCGEKKVINQLALISPDCYAAAIGHWERKKGKVLVIHTKPDLVIIPLEVSKTEPFTAIACSPDGKFLAAACKTTLIIWQKDTKNIWKKIKTKKSDSTYIDLKFLDLPYGRLLIACGNYKITFFDSNNFKKIGIYSLIGEASCYAFAPDGESCFSSGQIHRFSDIRAALFAAVQKKAEDEAVLDLAKQTELYRSLSSVSVDQLYWMKVAKDRKRELSATVAGKVRYALKHYRSLTLALFNTFCFASLGTAWFTHSVPLALYPWIHNYAVWHLLLAETKVVRAKKAIIPTLIGAGMGLNVAALIAPHTSKYWVAYMIGNVAILGLSTFFIIGIGRDTRLWPSKS